MSSERTRTGYSAAQVSLHWLIALLVLFQLYYGDVMAETGDIFMAGGTPTPFQNNISNAHYFVGIAILALVLVRIVARLVYGVPASPQGSASWMVLVANIVHGLFYLLLVVVPILGLLGYYYGDPYASIHALAKPTFIVLICLHAGAALYHQFFLKDGTLRRMLAPV